MKGSPPAIRIGFIGCGRATEQLHLPALKSVQGVEVTGLADPDPDALRRSSRHVQARHVVADFHELLRMASIDAVAICVPAQSHVEVALAALDAGKHIFIEKPLALTLEDCDRLIAHASKTNRIVMLGFNARWHRLAGRARTMIQQGQLGRLDVIRSLLTSFYVSVPEWRASRATGGGALMEMAVHHFDLWRYLTGLEVDEVSAFARSGTWEDESVAVIARMTHGVLATAACAERASQNNTLDICGREGSMTLSLYRFDGLERASTTSVPGDLPGRIAAAKRFVRELPGAVSVLRHGGEWRQSYVQQWMHFVDCVQRRRVPACTLHDGRRAVAIALAAAESAATGRHVRVNRG